VVIGRVSVQSRLLAGSTLAAALRTLAGPEDRARRGEGLCPQWGSGDCAQDTGGSRRSC